MIPNLTFDTSCIIPLLGLSSDNTAPDEVAALEKIKIAHENGALKIWVSQKSLNEATLNLQSAGNDPSRIEKWLSTLKLLDEFDVARSAWILDTSGLDTDTASVTDEQAEEYNQICEILVGNKTGLKLGDIFDIAIFYEHRLQGNELFVMRDTKIFRKTVITHLLDKFNIRVVKPTIAIDVLRAEYFIEL
jgi:hypothetical protein